MLLSSLGVATPLRPRTFTVRCHHHLCEVAVNIWRKDLRQPFGKGQRLRK
jgi:hypothetical protein